MRWIAATAVLVACGTTPAPRAPSPRAPSQTPPAEFLLASAAADFHAHRPPDPIGFRDVRFGHVVTTDGTKQYMLCGQFLPSGRAEGVPFTTIKTSDYEQWIGQQGSGICSSITRDDPADLSPALQRRFEALK